MQSNMALAARWKARSRYVITIAPAEMKKSEIHEGLQWGVFDFDDAERRSMTLNTRSASVTVDVTSDSNRELRLNYIPITRHKTDLSVIINLSPIGRSPVDTSMSAQSLTCPWRWVITYFDRMILTTDVENWIDSEVRYLRIQVV